MKRPEHLMRIAGIAFLILVCFSCSGRYDRSTDVTLRQAENNKKELEKVLSFYTSPEDSLKREAARFLVRNMSASFCETSDSFEKFNDMLFEAVKGRTDNYYTGYHVFASVMDSLMEITGSSPFGNLSRKYDSRTLTADFIIQNIEYAFKAWENNPWAKNVSFEDFCSYILPYRADAEPVDIDRKKMFSKYTKIARACDDTDDPKAVFDYMQKNIVYKYHRLIDTKYPYPISMEQSDILGMGSCIHAAIYNTMIMRSIGLPAAVDYTPQWGNYKGNHYMTTLVTSNRSDSLLTNNNSDNTAENSRFEISFNSGLAIPQDSLPAGFTVQYIKTISKIFRITGAIQTGQRCFPAGSYADETGIYSGLLEKDVTDEYVECSDITIKIDGVKKGKEMAYLCVFSEGKWIPVCATFIEKGKAVFSKMGRMIVYLAMINDRGIMKPVSQPFYFTAEGTPVFIKPDKQKASEIKLVSKYPLFSYAARHARSMKSGRFEGANRPDFRDAEALCRIDYYPFYYQEINLECKNEFRYYRYVAPERVTYGFAELGFFTTDRSDTIPMKGRYFDEFNSDPEYFRNLADNDLNTNVTGIPRKDSWIGYDAGKKTRLTKIRFAPVNDANCIIPGRVYELLHWDDGRWISLGKQTASSSYLEYSNAPKNALLWLRCLSEGTEERIFTWENGKQVWW